MKKKKEKKNNPLKGLLLSLRWDMIPTEWSKLTEVRKKKQWRMWRMWRIQGRGLRTRYPPLFLDQTTEAWRVPLPPYIRVWMTAGLPPTPSTSPYLKIRMCHWRVILEAALWVKLLKVFFRLKQLNSLSGKKIPYHFWNLHNSFKMR